MPAGSDKYTERTIYTDMLTTAGRALQANFRFLVSDSVDLRRYAGDADLMLDWDDVLQVSVLRLAASGFK